MMLNMIKFNIAVTSLRKEESRRGGKEENGRKGDGEDYIDTGKYIEMFITETEDTDFIKVMQTILELIASNLSHTHTPSTKKLIRTI